MCGIACAPTHVVDLDCEHSATLSGNAQGSHCTHLSGCTCCPHYGHVLSLHLIHNLRCSHDADLAPFDDYAPCCGYGPCLSQNLSCNLRLCHVPCTLHPNLSQSISPVTCCFPWWLRDDSGSFPMNTTQVICLRQNLAPPWEQGASSWEHPKSQVQIWFGLRVLMAKVWRKSRDLDPHALQSQYIL